MLTKSACAMFAALTLSVSAWAGDAPAQGAANPPAQSAVDVEARRRMSLMFANAGYIHYRASRYEQAFVQYSEAVELEPSNPDYLYSRGIMLGWLGNYDDAIRDLSDAIRLKPDFKEACDGLRSVCAWKSYWLAKSR